MKNVYNSWTGTTHTCAGTTHLCTFPAHGRCEPYN